MLNLFSSIFQGTEKSGHYPKSLVDEAIERAVDSTDPWLRGLNGYRRKLRPAVLAAIDHVVALVDRLPPPRLATRDAFACDPLLQAMFLSSGQMQQILQDQLAKKNIAADPAYALLIANLEQRGIFGADLQGETVVRDVAQMTVSFSNHRLLDPGGTENETRDMLKHRAFDHLLSLALRRLVATRELRKDLDNRRTLLKAKLDLLKRGKWGFNPGDMPPGPDSFTELERQLAENQAQLELVGSDDRSLEVAKRVLTEVLEQAADQLWLETTHLIVDRMGIKRSVASDTATELQLNLLHNADGRSLVVTLVRVKA